MKNWTPRGSASKSPFLATCRSRAMSGPIPGDTVESLFREHNSHTSLSLIGKDKVVLAKGSTTMQFSKEIAPNMERIDRCEGG